MSLRILWALPAAFALFAAQPASAVPITPGTTYTLNVGEYEHNPSSSFVIGAGNPFTFDYFFDVSQGAVTLDTFLSAHLALPNPGMPAIANLMLSWYQGAPIATPLGGAVAVTDSNGQTIANGAGPLVLPYIGGASTAFDYVLRITGEAFFGGRYNLTVDVSNNQAPPPVPLPGALVLLGSALAGAGVLSRYRRKAAAA